MAVEVAAKPARQPAGRITNLRILQLRRMVAEGDSDEQQRRSGGASKDFRPRNAAEDRFRQLDGKKRGDYRSQVQRNEEQQEKASAEKRISKTKCQPKRGLRKYGEQGQKRKPVDEIHPADAA